jgi:hypothetical protein
VVEKSDKHHHEGDELEELLRQSISEFVVTDAKRLPGTIEADLVGSSDLDQCNHR